MNGWTTTRVWVINDNLVVAPTIDEAIATMRLYVPDTDIESVKSLTAGYGKSNEAIIKE